MEAPEIKAIVFDCFGVLYTDSKASIRSLVPTDKQQALSDLYASNDHGYLAKDNFLEEVARLAGIKPEKVEAVMKKQHVINAALKTLISERLRGHYRIGLLSNIGRGWINDFFNTHELHGLFDEVVLSGEEGLTKPQAEIFELMAVRLGVEPKECIMIDDLEENCEGAEIVGMQSIHFISNDQLINELYSYRLLVP